MINKNGIEIGKYINKTLNQFSANELIDITENFSNENKSTMMKKIFEQIEREKNENEYSRTEVYDRAMYLTDQLLKFQFDLNQSGALRIHDSSEASAHKKSYINKMEE